MCIQWSCKPSVPWGTDHHVTTYLLVAICLYLFRETLTFTSVLSTLLSYSENGASTAEVKRTMGDICLDPKPCNCITSRMEIGALYTETRRVYEAEEHGSRAEHPGVTSYSAWDLSKTLLCSRWDYNQEKCYKWNTTAQQTCITYWVCHENTWPISIFYTNAANPVMYYLLIIWHALLMERISSQRDVREDWLPLVAGNKDWICVLL